MIYLHKILPVFLMPTGLAMLLIASGLFLRRRILCWIGIGLLWFCSTPVVAFPVDFQVSEDRAFTVLDLLPGAEGLRQTEAALREGYGFLYYALVRR